MKKQIVNFLLQDNHFQEMKRICHEEDITVSQVLRKLVREWLKERKQQEV